MVTIPEENLKEVIIIIKMGIYYQKQWRNIITNIDPELRIVSKETIQRLEKWCEEQGGGL